MTLSWRAASAALDAGSLLFAMVNVAYFLGRLLGAEAVSPARRLAIVVLLLLSAGTLLEAAVLLAALEAGDDAPLLSSSQWFIVRLLSCTASGGVCALVLRRSLGGG